MDLLCDLAWFGLVRAASPEVIWPLRRPLAVRCCWLASRLSTSFGCTVFAVVFLVVDLTAGSILLAVDLLTLLAGQLAAVRHAIVMYLLVDVRLRTIRASRFAGGHLAAAQAIGNALVLVRLAVVGIVVAAGRAVGCRNRLRLACCCATW